MPTFFRISPQSHNLQKFHGAALAPKNRHSNNLAQ
jgi:hypothetical protein